MDRFHTRVEVRSRWQIYPQVVFSSEDDPREVDLRWNDNAHLIVRYTEPENYNVHAECSTAAKDVLISYEPKPGR